MELDKKYWDNKYKNNQTGWDLNSPSTPLKEYIDQLNDKNLKILIPGCGNAYEAEYLLTKGFKNITILDISEIITRKLQEKFKNNNSITVIHKDFFKLEEKFDLIFEQTFFCALNPEIRADYVKKVHQILSPKGKLVGVLFNKHFNNPTPPYGGNKDEYIKYFKDYFSTITMEECNNSIKPRKGSELFINLVKK